MQKTTQNSPAETALPGVEDWRLQELGRLGFKFVHAEQLAVVADVAHKAARLLAGGCSHLNAYLLLREP